VDCQCIDNAWQCASSQKPDLCAEKNCPEGKTCDPNTGVCSDETPASPCENIQKPADGKDCECVDNAWQCKYSEKPDLCAKANCPTGKTCDPNTGDCVDDVSASNCENIAKPENGEDCQCVDNAWQCTFPEKPEEPKPDPCEKQNCPLGQKCDLKTGKCVDAYPTEFLFTKGKDICTKASDGGCKKIQLRGLNLGMWLSRSIWGLPISEITEAMYKEMGEVRPDVNNIEILNALKKHGFSPTQVNALSEALYDNFITTDDLDVMKDLGINLVRVPFEWTHLMSCDGNKQNCVFLSKDDSVLFKHMDWIVDECGKRGIYVIFDLHVAQGNLNMGGYREKAEFLEEKYSESIVRMWDKISKRYKNISAVAGYDLVNEPQIDKKYGDDYYKNNKKKYVELYGNKEDDNAKKAGALAAFYDKLYQVIRKNGDKHIIFMEEDCVFCGVPESNGYSTRKDIGMLPDPKKMNWNENVVYSVHNYYWTNRLKNDTKCGVTLDCNTVCSNNKDINKCNDLCAENYYECITHVFFPPMHVFKNRVNLKLGENTDHITTDKNGVTSSTIHGVMNSYNIPIYIGEFNSLFNIAKVNSESNCSKNLPKCFNDEHKDVDFLDSWTYEMQAYDKAGLSYSAWTYKAVGKSWQALIYYGSRNEKKNEKESASKVDLLTDSYEFIMKIFSRTSKTGMFENTAYKNMLKKHLGSAKP
jgi:hypothetical protein